MFAAAGDQRVLVDTSSIADAVIQVLRRNVRHACASDAAQDVARRLMGGASQCSSTSSPPASAAAAAAASAAAAAAAATMKYEL